MSPYKNLNDSCAFHSLRSLPPVAAMATELTADRVQTAQLAMAGGLVYNFAAKPVNTAILSALQAVSDEMELLPQFRQLIDGELMNGSEQRKVLHHLTRGQLGAAVLWQGCDLREYYEQQRQRIAEFAGRIHDGQLRGSRGDRFRHVCQIGIGGSDLGPRAIYLALIEWVRNHGRLFMPASFISNVDPDDAGQFLATADLASTLFILVSKSGTTQETLTNEALICQALRGQGLDPAAHVVAVTSESSPLAQGTGYLECFYIDDFIGGRYSTTSAVGGVVLSLSFGATVFEQFLDGARAQDRLALSSAVLENPSLLDALLGVYERNCLGYPCTAVLPYSQALGRFPAHLQQLDMESNGKSVNRNGQFVDYATGPIVFGEAGTNSQHSFYQLLHQGTDIVPLQFIGFRSAQGTTDIQVDGSSSQDKLNANLAAQIEVFAKGQSSSDPNTFFAGQRPVSLIYGDALTPQAMGALLAHFENKVMFQGFLWNLNSFDQPAVQLGKKLTQQLLQQQVSEGSLFSLARLLHVLASGEGCER